MVDSIQHELKVEFFLLTDHHEIYIYTYKDEFNVDPKKIQCRTAMSQNKCNKPYNTVTYVRRRFNK